MKIRIQRKFSDNKGTHYCLYVGDCLIHYEFSRSIAEELADRISEGEILSDILNEKVEIRIKSKERQVKKLEKDLSEAKSLKLIGASKIYSKKSNTPKLLEVSRVKIDFNVNESEISSYKNSLSKEEADELSLLIADMKQLNFSHSKELSNYITKNNLGHKYPNISGVVKMKKGDDTWDFDGGFPTIVYRIICVELDLHDNGSMARPIGFKPYKNITSK